MKSNLLTRTLSIIGQTVLLTVVVAGGVLIAKEVDKKIEEKKSN